MTMEKKKIAGLVLSGLVLIGAGMGSGFILDKPQVIQLPGEIIYEDKIVEVEKLVEVEKIVEVDNGDMKFVLCRLEDKDIIDDCQEIVEELKAEDSALQIALKLLEDEEFIFDMLEDEDLIEDEDDVSIIRVYSDFEDVIVLKSDFDDEEYKFKIKMKIRDEDSDEKKTVRFIVEVEDGEGKIVSVS